MRIFGIDPGSERTGYGCVETDGRRHHLVACGAISAPAGDAFPDRLARIHRELTRHLADCRPDCVAVENLFFATNVRSALKLGHARGVAMLAAVQAGCAVVEYTPAEVKRAVVGYGRADKNQVQQMVKLLLGLTEAPSPHDAADALAIAICHLHSLPPAGMKVHLKVDTTNAVHLELGTTNAGHLKVDTTSEIGAGLDVVSGLSRTVTAKRAAKPLTSWRQYRPPTA